MKIEIDQSGRVEYTSKPTVVGFSNSKEKTIIILATEKQKLQKYFRKANKPHVFIYKVFAILILLLLKNEHIEQIIIDREYLGQENLIKSYLLDLLRRTRKDFDKKDITFKSIGKKSRAHTLVYNAYRTKKADISVRAEEIRKFI
jgi:hypothetical protein